MPKKSFGIKKFFQNNIFDREAPEKLLKHLISEKWGQTYFFDPKKEDRCVKRRTWLDLVTHFLALPFFSFDQYPRDYSKKDVFIASFFGWDERRFLTPFNIIRVVFVFLANILLIVPKLILNIVSLGTEFLPVLFKQLTNNWINRLLDRYNSKSYFGKFLTVFALIILFPLHFICKTIELVGRSITSPTKSLYIVWKAGEDLAGDGIWGKIAGLLFCVVSLAVTLAAYIILFPIAIKLAITYAPPVVVSAIQSVINFCSPWFVKIGSPISKLVTPLFQAMGPFFAKAGSPLVLGFSVVIGAALGPLGVALDKINVFERISAWWRKQEKIQNIRKAMQQKNQNNRNVPQKQAVPQPQPQVRKQKVQKNAQRQLQKKSQGFQNQELIEIPESEIIKEKFLGEGSFGSVFQGKYNGNVVAIKEVKKFAGFQNNKELQGEINIMAKLNSPQIVRFYGICKAKGMIVMEFISNGCLWDLLRKPSCPAWAKGRYQIGLDIACGLVYLHKNNVIHLDLKSDNILITPDFRAKISDFGMSKLKAANFTAAATLIGAGNKGGAIRWRAPELFEPHAKGSTKADVHSCGMLLWELGAKKAPFEEIRDNIQVISAIISGQKEKVAADTPPGMTRVINNCIKQDPESRPDMEEVKGNLEQEGTSYGCRFN